MLINTADLYRSFCGMVFSPIQNRLTQSLRDHPDIAPDMATIMPAEDQDMYSAWLTEWHDILDVARGCIQTTCQRLIEARDMQGLQLLTRQLSDQARKELASLIRIMVYLTHLMIYLLKRFLLFWIKAKQHQH